MYNRKKTFYNKNMMNEYTLRQLLDECISKELIQMILSNPRTGDGPSKAKIRPILLKDKLLFQVSETRGQKVLHTNYDEREVKEYIEDIMQNHFRQLQSQGGEMDGSILVSKKGKMSIKTKKHPVKIQPRDLSHNRTKKYILQENVPVPFLIDLGVQNTQGKIITKRYDKFRQLNRFLEFIEDILPKLPTDREVTILDFGCGKSYLTFAMYHYLKVMKGYDINIIGLDLKEDVIKNCSELAKSYGYDKLHFYQGDIADYEGVNQVDMVVTLHACDTATDYALYKAVRWGASVILSVPCCQHEVNKQLENKMLEPILSYGILKERTAALFTDGIRAGLLEEQGYETQILEFIDMEHTPKNLLIRAVKTGKKQEKKELHKMMEELHLSQCLDRLLREEGGNS